ncbi:MAG: hypothetical protein Q9168_004755 [Polycauliona sp. 1 TL-2023]
MNMAKAAMKRSNDTKASVAERLGHLAMIFGNMMRIAQSLLYWMSIVSKLAWTVLCKNNNFGGDAKPMSVKPSSREVDASLEQRPQHDTKCDIGNSMVCRLMLKLAGRKLEDYNRHYTKGLEMVEAALSVHRRTARSKHDEEADGVKPTDENMLDGRMHAMLVQVSNFLVKLIVQIGDCIGERLPTDFIMVIQGPTGEMQHVAGLDSGSAENLISRRTALAAGLSLEPYPGPPLIAVGGSSIRPVGRVTFGWCVSNYDTWYSTTFAVLEDGHCRDFNILLSKEEIVKRRFYIRNRDVLFCSRGFEQPLLANQV